MENIIGKLDLIKYLPNRIFLYRQNISIYFINNMILFADNSLQEEKVVEKMYTFD